MSLKREEKNLMKSKILFFFNTKNTFRQQNCLSLRMKKIDLHLRKLKNFKRKERGGRKTIKRNVA